MTDLGGLHTIAESGVASDVLDERRVLLDHHVQAARKGDVEAFDALVRATYAHTYSLAYKLTGNAEDADDVAQDTYLRAFRALARFRGDAAFPTWLYRITVNSASNLLTKRRRSVSIDALTKEAAKGSHRHGHHDDHDQPLLQLVETHPDADPVERVIAADLRERVRVSLAGLPSLLRQVLVLREVEGLPHSAIAERLGISETAAKVRLHRARQKLKADLDCEPDLESVPQPAREPALESADRAAPAQQSAA
jgi:RNA polymerase sigma-70 factor, ECF subfamily